MRVKDPDHNLVAKAKSGNKKALTLLVQKYQDMILYLSYDLCGDYEVAKDLAQNVFMKMITKMESFRYQSRFSSWLYRIAVNTCLDHLRANKKEKITSKNIDVPGNSIAGVEQALEQEELEQIISKSMEKLSENQSTALILRYYHQKSTREIAEILQCKENTVRLHIFRAMQKLRIDLKGLQ